MTSTTTFKLKEKYPYYLGNKAVYANENLKLKDKYTNKVVASVAQADASVIDKAIELAVKSQKALKKMGAWKRKEILMYVVEEVKKRFDEFAYSLCIEAGKPLKDARGEVTRLIDTFTLAAEESTRIYGEYAPLDISKKNHGIQSITKKFPIGPISMISPFNFPLNLAAHKIAPAIACGCPWVMKPASRTPIGAILLGEILSKTDLPVGSFSILPCTRKGAGLFTTDDRFKLLSFTGSPQVGWALKRKCGKKKVCLELGGNAGCIVDGDQEDNLEYISDRIVIGGFYQSGQSCISVQKVFVHEKLYDDLKKMLVSKVSKLKKGNPMNIDTFIGPMIAESEAKRCEEWVNEAVKLGGKLLCGGKREGVFYDATIVENVPKHAKLSKEEVFGPVICIESFKDFKKAVETVDDTKFGLQAGVFTSNINKIFYAYEELEVGGVVVNDVPSIRVDSQSYGGVRDSGLGREGIRYAIEDMTELKVLLLKNIGKL